MTETTNDVVADSTETVEASKFDYEMVALSSRLFLNSPKRNAYFAEGMTLYVTEKPSNGALRVSQSVDDLGLSIGQTVNFDHATRKGQYGNLRIVGIVAANGDQSGLIPTKSLALREIVATVE